MEAGVVGLGTRTSPLTAAARHHARSSGRSLPVPAIA